VDVKQAATTAEVALERRAEPLAPLYLRGGPHDAALADAWKDVVRNAAHDSICACSTDDVVDAVIDRYRRAARTGDAIANKAVQALADSMAEAGPIAVNPSARTRGGVVEI